MIHAQISMGENQHLSKNAEILSIHEGMDKTTWRLGLFNTLDDPNLLNALQMLCKEALLPNVFFELPYIKAASSHFSQGNEQYLFLTKQTEKHETLQFFMPVKLDRINIQRDYVLQSWTHDYANLGMPLVAKNNVRETLEAFCECIQNAKHDKAKAIVINYLPIEGEFIENLYLSKKMSNRILLAKGMTRAGLKPMANNDYASTYLSGSRKQRHKKAIRELEVMGKLTFCKTSDAEDIKNEVDEFLELEESGWKGRKNTALNLNPQTRNLTRNAVYSMASSGKCAIYTLRQNNKPLAKLIMFMNKGHYHTWKIAYDESYARYSVGNLLTVYATTDVSQSDGFCNLDSLAADFNKTALRFWPDEKQIFTMVIGIGDKPCKNTLRISRNLNSLWYIKTKLRNLLIKP